MKRLLLALAAAAVGFAAYTYYFSDTLTSINATNWTQNGTVTGTTGGLTATTAGGGSLISKVAVPGGPTNYEVKTTLTLTVTGGTYTTYLRASTDALNGPTTTGSFYAVELQNPTFTSGVCSGTLAVYKRVSSVLTSMGTSTVACQNAMTIRIAINASGFFINLSTGYTSWFADTSILSGQPGIGARSTPAGNSIARVDLGPADGTAPGAVDPQSVGTSQAPTRVDFQWQGVVDNTNGSGFREYQIFRNGAYFATVSTSEFSDGSVAAGTSYSYTIYAYDYHYNVSTGATVTVTTPPAAAIDPRRVGVRPTGAYWGAAGEQIDAMTGNVNYTASLFRAQGRGGWSVPFALNYNSQLWRQDPGGTWKLGQDVGYGFGWKLLAGSLTPIWSGWLTLDHYFLTDSTGAEYRLDTPNTPTAGIWTTSTGLHVWYDSNVGRLYFPDGSFWIFGAISGGTEQDAGTMYPTAMEDSNGNQIIIAYNTGLNATTSNSCARFTQIEDVRAVGAAPKKTWTFTYNADPIPHLTNIDGLWVSGEASWTLVYSPTPVALNSPFSPSVSYAATTTLSSVNRDADGMPAYLFAYDTAIGSQVGSQELTQLTTMRSGTLQWAYRSFTYTGSRTLREVQTRTLAMQSGGGLNTYTFTHDDATDAGLSMHSWTKLDDASGNGQRQWTFATTGAASQLGLATNITYRTGSPSYTALKSQDFTWVLDGNSNNPYIGTVLTKLDPGTGNEKQSKTVQIQDTYGNVSTSAVYDYGATPVLARTYTNTYKSTSSYLSRYIYNRLLTTTLTDGVHNFTLVTNTYDGANPADAPSIREHDTAYGTTFQTRGNVTSTTPLGGPTVTITRDITGNAISASDGQGHSIAPTIDSTTNYVVPSTFMDNGDSTSIRTLGYTAALTPNSYAGPNATASAVYDTLNRPTSSTAVDGAVTTYTYSTPGTIPSYAIATTNGRWVKTSYDGFDRTINVQRGYSTTTVSNQDTIYSPCACSPIGKVSQVSQPYAPGGTPVNTTYYYDGLGRSTSVVSPDGLSTTTHAYAGNAITVTDPAGIWKQTVMDVFGNITTVNEPNPAGGANLATNYTYDILGHLTQVSMTRGATTQLRTFVYDANGRLYTETHPESGMKTYTYNTDGTLATRVDAKNQQVKYIYDTYQHVTQIQRYPVTGGAEDTCQRMTFTYGTTVGSSNTWGRRKTAAWGGTGCSITQNQAFSYSYEYTPSGRLTKKGTTPFTYDNEGRQTSYTNPANGIKYTYGFDAMGRPTSLTDNQTTPFTWVSSAVYGPADEMLSLTTSTGGSGSFTYNSRLQLTNLTTGNGSALTYTFSPNQNNGQITQAYDSGETITYTYDSLKRVVQANSNGVYGANPWGQGYVYDGFGNLTDKNVTSGSAQPLHVIVNAANNRINGSVANVLSALW